MKKRRIKLLFRIILYCFGIWLMAIGTAIAINTKLGISPKSSFSYILSIITNIRIGFCVILISIIHIILEFIVLRSNFKITNLAQIIPSLFFGNLIDISNKMICIISTYSYFFQLFLLIFSSFIIGFGVSLYVSARLIPLTAEGLCIAIAEKYGYKFYNVKTAQDLFSVSLTIVFSCLFFHKIIGIREGTIILSILTGRFVKYIQKAINPMFKKLL